MALMMMVKRRTLLLGTSAAAALSAWPVRAQTAAASPARIGLLFVGSPEQRDEIDRNLLAGLAELGYVEGRNLVLERG